MASKASVQVSPSQRAALLFSRLASRLRFSSHSRLLLRQVLKEVEAVNLELEALLRYSHPIFSPEVKSCLRISRIIKAGLEGLSGLARRRGLLFSCSLEADPLVHVNEEDLSRAFLGILLATVERSPGAPVWIQVSQKGTMAIIAISAHRSPFVCLEEGGIRPPIFCPLGPSYQGLVNYAERIIRAHRGYLSSVRGPHGDVSYLLCLPLGGPLSLKGPRDLAP
ncbi:hypothetical protein [Thermosulfuriphilus sp.]